MDNVDKSLLTLKVNNLDQSLKQRVLDNWLALGSVFRSYIETVIANNPHAILHSLGYGLPTPLEKHLKAFPHDLEKLDEAFIVYHNDAQQRFVQLYEEILKSNMITRRSMRGLLDIYRDMYRLLTNKEGIRGDKIEDFLAQFPENYTSAIHDEIIEIVETQ